MNIKSIIIKTRKEKDIEINIESPQTELAKVYNQIKNYTSAVGVWGSSIDGSFLLPTKEPIEVYLGGNIKPENGYDNRINIEIKFDINLYKDIVYLKLDNNSLINIADFVTLEKMSTYPNNIKYTNSDITEYRILDGEDFVFSLLSFKDYKFQNVYIETLISLALEME